MLAGTPMACANIRVLEDAPMGCQELDDIIVRSLERPLGWETVYEQSDLLRRRQHEVRVTNFSPEILQRIQRTQR